MEKSREDQVIELCRKLIQQKSYSGEKVLFDEHIDTVPVTEEDKWLYPPFAAEIHDGKMYGRGTSDMKGAVAAMTCAAANFAKDTGKDFAGEIYVAGVVHEECFEGVAAREISKNVQPDYVVIGATSLPPKNVLHIQSLNHLRQLFT